MHLKLYNLNPSQKDQLNRLTQSSTQLQQEVQLAKKGSTYQSYDSLIALIRKQVRPQLVSFLNQSFNLSQNLCNFTLDQRTNIVINFAYKYRNLSTKQVALPYLISFDYQIIQQLFELFTQDKSIFKTLNVKDFNLANAILLRSGNQRKVQEIQKFFHPKWSLPLTLRQFIDLQRSIATDVDGLTEFRSDSNVSSRHQSSSIRSQSVASLRQAPQQLLKQQHVNYNLEISQDENQSQYSINNDFLANGVSCLQSTGQPATAQSIFSLSAVSNSARPQSSLNVNSSLKLKINQLIRTKIQPRIAQRLADIFSLRPSLFDTCFNDILVQRVELFVRLYHQKQVCGPNFLLAYDYNGIFEVLHLFQHDSNHPEQNLVEVFECENLDDFNDLLQSNIQLQHVYEDLFKKQYQRENLSVCQFVEFQRRYKVKAQGKVEFWQSENPRDQVENSMRFLLQM